MADLHFERTLPTRQICAPMTGTDDFSDRRVFFIHDGSRCGEAGLAYEQSSRGPTVVYIDAIAPDCVLAGMAERHGLVLDELIQFRDQWNTDIILATPAQSTVAEAAYA